METHAMKATDNRWPNVRRELLRRDAAFGEDILERGYEPIAHGYRKPKCFSCQSCLSLRVLVQEFNVTAEHSRTLKKNGDLTFTTHKGLPQFDPASGDDEFSRLYSEYLTNRFPQVENNQKTAYFDPQDAANLMAEYANFPGFTPWHIQARDEQGHLEGVSIVHSAIQSMSDTIAFYNLERRKTGLGHALTLHALAAEKKNGIVYHYLGFWTRSAGPYSWKDKFAPLEIRMPDGQWVRYETTHAVHALNEDPKKLYPGPRTYNLS